MNMPGKDAADQPDGEESLGLSGQEPASGSIFDRFAEEEPLMSMSEPESPFDQPEGKVVGDIESVLEHWDGQQSYPDTCAIRCQEYIIERFTGTEIDESELVREASEQGWYQPGRGTSPDCVGNLLESHGIDVHRYQNSNIFHLADELAQGHKVIIGVDSAELWNRIPLYEDLKDALGFEGANHAVVVSGIDTTEPGNPCVIITDPGTGEPAARYPLDQFVEAWRDSDFTMLATAEPPPAENCPEMVNFGTDEYRNMLFRVAGMPFLGYLQDLWTEVGEPGDFPYVASADDSAEAFFEIEHDPDLASDEPRSIFDSFVDSLGLGSDNGELGDDDGEADEIG